MEWKMVRYVMTLILFLGSKMKCMMTLNLCLMSLKKILEINYIYEYLKQKMARRILWRVTILFISNRMGEDWVLFREKLRWSEGKNCNLNESIYFGELFNQWVGMFAWFSGAWCFLSFRHTLWKTWWWLKTERRLGIRFFTWFIVKLYFMLLYAALVIYSL